MEFNSTIFGELLQVVDSPVADPQDARAKVDSRYSLTMVPGSISRPDTSGTRSESHWATSTVTVTNGVLTASTMTTLREGVWRITATIMAQHTAIAAPSINTLRVSQGGSVVGNLWGYQPIAATTGLVAMPLDVQLTLDRDTDLINLVNATGVGETFRQTIMLHCQRIA